MRKVGPVLVELKRVRDRNFSLQVKLAEAEDQRDRAMDVMAQQSGDIIGLKLHRDELLAALVDARDAIAFLPPGALGEASRTVTLPDGECGLMKWPIRDELLSKINEAIARATSSK